MDITFANEKDIFLIVYLDDLTVFLGSDDEHLHHLRVFFSAMQKIWDFSHSQEEPFFHG